MSLTNVQRNSANGLSRSLRGRGAEAEEQVIPGLGLAAARMREGDAAARVQPAALADVDRRVAVGLPAGVAVLGEEQIAAGPELEIAARPAR